MKKYLIQSIFIEVKKYLMNRRLFIQISLFSFLCSLFLLNCQEHPYRQGEIMYKSYCSNCHLDNGEGLKGLYPPLANSDYFKNHLDDVPCIIRRGLNDTIMVNGVQFDNPMAAIPQLKDPEITNIINYIQHKWGDGTFTTIQEVRASLKKCE